MNFGLRDDDLQKIIEAITKFKEIKSAKIFGSRAKGNFKNGSDIDIAIIGEQVTFNILSELHGMLEEKSMMPYFFDIVDYTHLSDNLLREHIDRIGITIYTQE